jgi:hypothetical protein
VTRTSAAVDQSRPGEIIVLDRAGLERIAGDFYGLPEHEYRRLIG